MCYTSLARRVAPPLPEHMSSRKLWLVSLGAVALFAAGFFTRAYLLPITDEQAVSPLQTDAGFYEGRTLALYDVTADGTINVTEGASTPVYEQTWDRYQAIVANTDLAEEIQVYRVYEGPYEFGASVIFTEQDELMLEINMNGYELDTAEDRLFTLVHELAHVLSLSGDQFTLFVPFPECQGYYTGDGCAPADSYLAEYVRQFWTPLRELRALKGDYTLYEDSPSAFVSDYAAFSPEEDFAETFAVMVLEPDSVKPGSIAAAKVAFLERYPELVRLREQIVENVEAAGLR